MNTAKEKRRQGAKKKNGKWRQQCILLRLCFVESVFNMTIWDGKLTTRRAGIARRNSVSSLHGQTHR
jgi:hypothetical protein